jgi:hypothetical protein
MKRLLLALILAAPLLAADTPSYWRTMSWEQQALFLQGVQAGLSAAAELMTYWGPRELQAVSRVLAAANIEELRREIDRRAEPLMTGRVQGALAKRLLARMYASVD